MRKLPRTADPRIVDGDVDAAECGDGVGDAAVDLVVFGDVDEELFDLDGGVKRLQLVGGGAQGWGGAVGEGEALDAVFGEGEGGCFADSWRRECKLGGWNGGLGEFEIPWPSWC